MSHDANETETYGDYSVDDEDQLQPEDTLEDTGDPLDEGYTAPDDYSAGQRYGNTPAEEERGETFAQRLRQEEPESGDPWVDDTDQPAEEAAIHEVDE
jgi:hypothetical protein